jgi:ABC-type sugar transport system ATPase subunit
MRDQIARVSLECVSERWGGFVCLSDVNLEIDDQELMAFDEPLDCSKTTPCR